MPPTGWGSGRAGKPRSHWRYTVADPPRKAQEKFADLDGVDLLEVRSTGGQAVIPPSAHESGEPIVWHSFDEPAEVGLGDLLDAGAVATVALLAGHWPHKGTRQDAFLALSGGLPRGGWAHERCGRFVCALAAATGDEEARKWAASVGQTARKLDDSSKATGWPTLDKLLGSAARRSFAASAAGSACCPQPRRGRSGNSTPTDHSPSPRCPV